MDRLVYFIYRAVSRGIALLPLGVSFRFGAMAGGLAYWALAPYRRLALANLSIAFGGEKSPAELRKIARAHFSLLGANLVSSIKVATLSPDEILKLVKIDNLDFFLSPEAKSRGVVMAISHSGNWEILAQVCPLIFPNKGGTIYQRLGNEFIDADIRAARARQGLRLFERKEGFTGAIALIRDGGGGVGVLIDQHAGDKGIWCPLFGRLASTTPIAATMALRSGAVLLSAAISTDGPGRWRMSISAPIDTTATRDPAVLTAQVNQELETLIRRSPADWFWVHNRWKTPSPNFLLSEYKRGVVLPPGFAPEQLKPFRILVRSSNWLGDAVMTTPAVQAIKRGRPDARVTVLVKAKLAEYWKRVAEVDEVIEIEASDTVFAVAGKIRGKFDVAVILPNSIRTGLEVWLAGIPRRVGYPAKGRRWLLNQLMLPSKKKEKKPQPAGHQVHHYLEIARRLGASLDGLEGAKPEQFFATPAAASSPRPRAAGAPIKIGLCPGAEYGPAKRWLPERFAEVARAVAEHRDCEWVLFGVGGDAAVGAEIISKLTASKSGIDVKVVNLIGKTTLGELMDRLTECSLLLSNDTGTMHLAAALGVPTVSVFGSTEPRLTGPLGPGHRVLRHQVECSPCFLRECPIDFRCMKSIEPHEVVKTILAALPC